MRLISLGDSAITICLGRAGSATAVAQAIREANVAGITDAVPTFDDVTVLYDPSALADFDRFCERLKQFAQQSKPLSKRNGREKVVEIPTQYGGRDGPDLDRIARERGMSEAAFVARHANAEYRVLAVGFMPGFAYLGGLDEALHAPRLATPRVRVPAGSVGIGGSYTGIYPLETPGGWNLIGRTLTTLFEANRDPPSLLRVGDRVRFVSVSEPEIQP